MTIRFQLAAMRQIHWHEYLERFVAGGTVTVATGVIAHHFGPVVGGLFLAFPAIFPAGATLIEKHAREKQRRIGVLHTLRGQRAAALDARGAAMGSLSLATFALIVWKFLPSHTPWILGLAMGVWLAVAIALWRLRKLHVYGARSRQVRHEGGVQISK